MCDIAVIKDTRILKFKILSAKACGKADMTDIADVEAGWSTEFEYHNSS